MYTGIYAHIHLAAEGREERRCPVGRIYHRLWEAGLQTVRGWLATVHGCCDNGDTWIVKTLAMLGFLVFVSSILHEHKYKQRPCDVLSGLDISNINPSVFRAKG